MTTLDTMLVPVVFISIKENITVTSGAAPEFPHYHFILHYQSLITRRMLFCPATTKAHPLVVGL